MVAGVGLQEAAVRSIKRAKWTFRPAVDRHCTLISFFEVKTQISLTSALQDEDDPASARIQKMIIELTVLVATVAAMGAAIVKIYEWRQDVLYGPYLARERVEQNRRR
jgi:hypothetical protein